VLLFVLTDRHTDDRDAASDLEVKVHGRRLRAGLTPEVRLEDEGDDAVLSVALACGVTLGVADTALLLPSVSVD
jgi:hypothetical protein